jgi:exonuclease VII large subunit
LGRGYAIIRNQDNAVIKTVKEVSTGDQLTGQLADGEIVVSVSATTTKTL